MAKWSRARRGGGRRYWQWSVEALPPEPAPVPEVEPEPVPVEQPPEQTEPLDPA